MYTIGTVQGIHVHKRKGVGVSRGLNTYWEICTENTRIFFILIGS